MGIIMEKFQQLFNVLASTPDWVYLYLIPALIIGLAVGFVFASKRRWYFCPATFLMALGFIMAFAANRVFAVVYLAALVALCALLALLFLIPSPKKGGKDVKKSRLDTMYEKFHEGLSEKPYAPQSSMPPKECCFEKDDEGMTAEASGMSLDYANSLLNRLHESKLSAGDRLEVQELSARLDFYRGKALYEDERSALNDCLAAILKLTAKYQL